MYAFTAKHETFGLSQQARRAAVSIPANIAEGFRKRGKPDKARFLNIAEGSLVECDNFDHSPLDFLGGAFAQASTPGLGPIGSFGVLPPGVGTTWGAEWKRAALEWYDRVSRIILMADHFAYETNYLSLDPEYRDAYGDPLIRMTMDWTENERKLRNYVVGKVVALARQIPGVQHVRAPAPYRHYDATTYLGTHLQGGAIQGSEPEISLLNPWMQSWSMPNLFVVGGSAMPQNVFPNPTLTSVAQTLRTADALVRRYFPKPGSLA